MITSLLSLFITATISTNLGSSLVVPSPTNSIIQTASYDISNISDAESIPIKNPYFIAPIINAKASIGIDLATGTVLYEENSHDRLLIASITKLMTALIVLEENNIEDIATISSNAANIGGSVMRLQAGEKISLKNLLYGALIHSANDAAVALAEYNAGTVETFVKKMNAKASQLDLINTHFSNPIGLDDPQNYSSAYDVAKLARNIYQKQFVKSAALIKEIKVTSEDGAFTHKLESTNELLGNEFYKIKGLKTGKTDLAGLCLVVVAENNTGNEILTVVLNSPARFTETKILVDWLFRAYNW